MSLWFAFKKEKGLHLELENKATGVTQSVIIISSGWFIKGISMYIWKNCLKQAFTSSSPSDSTKQQFKPSYSDVFVT